MAFPRGRVALALAAGVVVVGAAAALLRSGRPQDGQVAASPTAISLPSASLSPGTVLADRFGFVSVAFANDPSSRRDVIRRENDARPTYDLADLGSPGRAVIPPSIYAPPSFYALAVSPDGRRLAYWTASTIDQLPLALQVLDLAPGARPRTLVTLTREFGDVAGESVVWSSDGTGLVLGVGVPTGLRCGADAPTCPPKRSALYLLDLAGGRPREIASIRGNSIVPVAWDRQARVVAAFESEVEGGPVRAYDVIEESGALKRTQMNIGLGGAVPVAASYDAKHVLAHDYAPPGHVVRVWPLSSPERAVEITPAGGDLILAPARWRPGTSEIGLLFDDRLELWDATGARRSIVLPRLPPSPERFRPFFFRIDGTAAFVGTYGSRYDYVAVELASGGSSVIPGEDWLSASVRIDP